MKKTLTVFVLVLSTIIFFTGRANAQNMSQLPNAAQTFIKTYFPKLQISKIEEDDKIYETKSFEVIFTNGYEVTFDSKGVWFVVDCQEDAIPEALIPVNINSYVKKNFPGDFITQIEVIKGEYDIELQSDLSLLFDRKGNFKSVDH
ncbi:hypothetical protein Bcop_2361 [Bacteroides coprosuis DSM 18011]|uniref:Putative beta-lactamase-inhibitor-like PepSY-like domain-containing protein n=1 Tax=Bacteroides coprosuis DSM 18011 TaxID=679937 RepID=F3ZNH9_9BACE|nr:MULTISPECIES: PepSY-like domain-containing protein [Bacteroides]EGJ72514.1 hypothetical protein Bcop_2361 [Bacteroides coprosuis DSM 18011]HJD93204.1 PepSY-like domain-containing protein [Bacteroides coprosuis]